MNRDMFIKQLKASGYKSTKTRKSLLILFTSNQPPLSIFEITNYLDNHNKKVNKTTVYRELDFLLSQNIIKELDFGEGKKRYELASLDHHHHLICLKCQDIQEVRLTQELEREESEILKNKGFQVVRHMLEFFGLCQSCQRKELHGHSH